MRKVLRHPLRAMTAALTLVGAAVVFVVLFVPLASAESPSGKNDVRGYENSKGSKTKKVGRDQLFIIVGKNLDHATTVDVLARDSPALGHCHWLGLRPDLEDAGGRRRWQQLRDRRWAVPRSGSSSTTTRRLRRTALRSSSRKRDQERAGRRASCPPPLAYPERGGDPSAHHPLLQSRLRSGCLVGAWQPVAASGRSRYRTRLQIVLSAAAGDSTGTARARTFHTHTFRTASASAIERSFG